MYESHITVTGMEDGEFVALCRKLNVKPVVIEDDTGSAGLRQMMTAKFHFTDDLERAMAEMETIAANFCTVLRRKLEYIVKRGKDPLPEHKYLEFHTKYELDHDQVESFVTKVASLGGHTSRNVLKHPSKPSHCYHFATARSRETWQAMLGSLLEYQRVNTIMECVVYDDAPDIDSAWAPCDACNRCNVKSPPSEFLDWIGYEQG